MSDQMTATMFIEMAVQRGLRTPDGEWTEKDPAQLATVARQAIKLARRLSAEADNEE